MRVALFSRNARSADAIGQQVNAKLQYFLQRGAEVRLYLEEAGHLPLDVKTIVGTAARTWKTEQDYLKSSDLVIAEFGAAYDLMHLLPALASQGPRIIVDYHGITPKHLVEPSQWEEVEAACRQRPLLWCADLVMVHSTFARRELLEAIELPAERVQVIPCFVGGGRARLLPSRGPREYPDSGNTNGRRNILFVGRFARNKHPEQLIEALPQLPVDVHAVFLGPQGDVYRGHLDTCRVLAARLNISHRVHFLGTVPDEELAAWYSAANVFVLPSEHECFGMPVVEAMARGTPVVISSRGALPEVMQHAGLQSSDMAGALRRLLSPHSPEPNNGVKRVALVAHRFGTQFAGGAERSLRLMATALQQQGYTVEVFTTCNTHESLWKNSLPAGTTLEDGFTVHRFPIDAYDAVRLGEAYQQIHQNQGHVSAEVEQGYLLNSLGSTALVEALAVRRDEFAAMLTGPYLFKLIYEVAARFTEKVLLAPCFHDEPLARLRTFQQAYRQVGGFVFHSEPEAMMTAELLGISQPRHAVVGTLLPAEAQHGDATCAQAKVGSPYLVYCGRYCPEKGLDRLVDYFEMLHTRGSEGASPTQHPCPLKLVCLGQGPMKLPSRPWLIDAGFVSEQEKRDYLAGAVALVNLSRNESLSIVALEAWAVKTPVIVDAQCPVLVDQVERSGGGWVVKDAEEFINTVLAIEESLSTQSQGESGHRYVQEHYLNPETFGQKLDTLVKSFARPLADVAREQGLERAALFSPERYTARFTELLDHLEQQAVCSVEHRIIIEPLQPKVYASSQMPSLPLSLRIRNDGDTLLAANGPAAASLVLQIVDDQGTAATPREVIALPKPLPPGKSQLMVAALSLPQQHGTYTLKVQVRQEGRPVSSLQIPVVVAERDNALPTGKPSVDELYQQLRPLLAEATRQKQLPTEYVDVTEGSFAPLKKAVKTRLLHNLRKAFLEPAFRQQSALNEKLLQAICLLAEAQAAQDVSATQAQLLRQMRQLERQLKRERMARRRLERQLNALASQTFMEGTAS
jgi:glycosyltransferase involved in cell wall biosynthesis